MDPDTSSEPTDLSGNRSESTASSLSSFGSEGSQSTTSSREIAAAEVVEEDGPKEGCVGGRAVTWGSASTVGRRKEMEDALAVAPEFMALACGAVGGCSAAPGTLDVSQVPFFGVYDGHGGSQVAKFCSERIHEVVAEEWAKVDDGEEWQKRWEVAFCDGFERVDKEVIEAAIAPDIIGSAAVVVVVSGCQIISSNCGDSRAVLYRGNQAIQLTLDHKPDREDEVLRIEGEGGKIIHWYGPRVFGVLAMSRAIGDSYMRPWIIPVPEVNFVSRSDEDECLILASDGLWDVLSNEEVGEVACRLLRRRRRIGLVDGVSPCPAQVTADYLVKLAFRKNSSDNISVIVVDLKSMRQI